SGARYSPGAASPGTSHAIAASLHGMAGMFAQLRAVASGRLACARNCIFVDQGTGFVARRFHFHEPYPGGSGTELEVLPGTLWFNFSHSGLVRPDGCATLQKAAA